MRALLFLSTVFLAGCGSSGGSSSGRVTASTYSAPAAANSAATKNLQLSWNASTGTPSGYYVEQSTDGSHFSLVKQVTVAQLASPSAPGVLIQGLTVGQTYFFRVAAYNAGGTSPYSSMYVVQP